LKFNKMGTGQFLINLFNEIKKAVITAAFKGEFKVLFTLR